MSNNALRIVQTIQVISYEYIEQFLPFHCQLGNIYFGIVY